MMMAPVVIFAACVLGAITGGLWPLLRPTRGRLLAYVLLACWGVVTVGGAIWTHRLAVLVAGVVGYACGRLTIYWLIRSA